MTGPDLDGRTVVVTGGTRGIGRAVALGAIRRGARVVCCARHADQGGAGVVDEAAAIAGAGRLAVVQADVSSEEDVARVFDTARTLFGPVDVAVNNAGTSASELLVSHSVSEWDRVVATNVTGCLLVARQLVRTTLTHRRPGALVTVGSLAQEGSATNASYTATKGALLGLTQGLAREYGAGGVRANLVVAGYVDTELARGLNPRTRAFLLDYVPSRRAGTVDEVAALILFLASDRSRHFNGQAVFVTGGLRQCPA